MIDSDERMRLEKLYEDMSEEQLSEMLSEGKDAYNDGVYEILKAVARSRGIEERIADAKPQNEVDTKACSACDADNVDTYVQILILIDKSDIGFVSSVLDKGNVRYVFQNINVKEGELPVALMVEKPRVDDAIQLLKEFKPHGGLILWGKE